MLLCVDVVPKVVQMYSYPNYFTRMDLKMKGFFFFFSTQDGMSYNGVELITIELSQQYWVWACLIQRIN